MFEGILLEQEQKDLLAALVEAYRNLPRDRREKFMVNQADDQTWVLHQGLPDRQLKACIEDIEILDREGLIVLSYNSRGEPNLFYVTPKGFKYYEEMKESEGEPVQKVESEIKEYLSAEHFRKKYPAAYQKWAEAEEKLWSSESERQLTTIGHLCREAVQEFATALVEQHQPPDVDPNKAHTIARLKAVLNLKKQQAGDTVHDFLDALLDYWRVLDGLIQRQEHGAKKEGEQLVWEDGRRVVFQTAVVMFEIDRSLSRIKR